MTLMLERPVLVPWRWIGHGIDLRVVIVERTAYFAADDVCQALGIDVPRAVDTFMDQVTLLYPMDTVILPGLDNRDGTHIHLVTAEQVLELDADRPMYQRDPGFAEWFQSLLEEHLTGPSLDRVVDAVLQIEEPPLDEPTYSVAEAARLLSRDPAITIGEKSLFEVMRTIGWIDRDHTYTWIPASGPLNDSLLVRQQVRVPGRRALYPQILITRDGLASLHRRLGGVLELQTDRPALVPLVDIS